jgi:kinetochore protein Nuf2
LGSGADADAGNLQMTDLKENIENEIHSAHDEYLKMDSHIKLYITEMEQSI